MPLFDVLVEWRPNGCRRGSLTKLRPTLLKTQTTMLRPLPLLLRLRVLGGDLTPRLRTNSDEAKNGR